ncbi:hypothetical protein KY363_04430 [Candidatus Woesearchaeota archaeon]|nr:hypothetical protein [Candidatus Woesearchaeota archaeon]
MRVDQCPKNLRQCPEGSCPSYPCWAYEEHLNKLDRDKKDRDSGWE